MSKISGIYKAAMKRLIKIKFIAYIELDFWWRIKETIHLPVKDDETELRILIFPSNLHGHLENNNAVDLAASEI